MANITHTIGSTGTVKRLEDLGSSVYADAVQVPARALAAETVLAGAASVLGKIGTVAVAAQLLVRCPASDQPYTKADWRVSCNKAHTVTLYKARSVVNAATLTLAAGTRVDDTDTCLLNALTYTAESTAGDAAYASRKWLCGGADITADAAALAALLNADIAIVPDGSVAVGETLTITTNLGTYIFTAAGAPVYPSRVFDQSGNQAAELASLVLAINHKDNVTLAAAAAADTVSVNNGLATYTYTAHTSTTTAANREFSIAGSNTQDGDALVTCINDATYGVPGITAVNAAGVVSMTIASGYSCTVTSSNGTRLACQTAGGVRGLVAAATGATGELALTPTYVTSIAAVDSSTHMTCTICDLPGVLASPAVGVITLTPGTPGAPSGGVKATVIQFAQGTSDANEIAFASSTLLSLIQHGDAIAGMADNSTTAGQLYEQWVDGWPCLYLGVTNNDAANPATVVVGATLYL